MLPSTRDRWLEMTTTAINARPVALAQSETVGFLNVVHSEWTKLRSVRSTYWTAGIAVVASIALSIAVCARSAFEIRHGKLDPQGFDSTLTSLDGLYIAQVAIGALGVLTIAGEYGTGMIRATLCTVPSAARCLQPRGSSLAWPP